MTQDFTEWLRSPDGGNCVDSKDIGNGLYVAIHPLMFHWTMIVGVIGDKIGYEDRWCYATRELAQKAFDEWTGEGDPKYWHRHPATGRRRENGDPTKEYINF